MGNLLRAGWIKMDAGLDALRPRPDIQALMMDLTFPINAFTD